MAPRFTATPRIRGKRLQRIRAAVAHAMGLDPHQAFQFSVRNLSLTRLEHHAGHWRVASVNEEPPLTAP